MSVNEKKKTGEASETLDEAARDLPSKPNLMPLIRDFISGFLELLKLEGALAVKSIKSSIIIGLLLLPLSFLTWLGLAVLVSWSLYELTGVALVGFATFFVMHLLLVLTCLQMLRTYKRRMMFSESRSQLNLAVRSVLDELSRESKKEQ